MPTSNLKENLRSMLTDRDVSPSSISPDNELLLACFNSKNGLLVAEMGDAARREKLTAYLEMPEPCTETQMTIFQDWWVRVELHERVPSAPAHGASLEQRHTYLSALALLTQFARQLISSDAESIEQSGMRFLLDHPQLVMEERKACSGYQNALSGVLLDTADKWEKLFGLRGLYSGVYAALDQPHKDILFPWIESQGTEHINALKGYLKHLCAPGNGTSHGRCRNHEEDTKHLCKVIKTLGEISPKLVLYSVPLDEAWGISPDACAQVQLQVLGFLKKIICSPYSAASVALLNQENGCQRGTPDQLAWFSRAREDRQGSHDSAYFESLGDSDEMILAWMIWFGVGVDSMQYACRQFDASRVAGYLSTLRGDDQYEGLVNIVEAQNGFSEAMLRAAKWLYRDHLDWPVDDFVTHRHNFWVGSYPSIVRSDSAGRRSSWGEGAVSLDCRIGSAKVPMRAHLVRAAYACDFNLRRTEWDRAVLLQRPLCGDTDVVAYNVGLNESFPGVTPVTVPDRLHLLLVQALQNQLEKLHGASCSPGDSDILRHYQALMAYVILLPRKEDVYDEGFTAKMQASFRWLLANDFNPTYSVGKKVTKDGVYLPQATCGTFATAKYWTGPGTWDVTEPFSFLYYLVSAVACGKDHQGLLSLMCDLVPDLSQYRMLPLPMNPVVFTYTRGNSKYKCVVDFSGAPERVPLSGLFENIPSNVSDRVKTRLCDMQGKIKKNQAWSKVYTAVQQVNHPGGGMALAAAQTYFSDVCVDDMQVYAKSFRSGSNHDLVRLCKMLVQIQLPSFAAKPDSTMWSNCPHVTFLANLVNAPEPHGIAYTKEAASALPEAGGAAAGGAAAGGAAVGGAAVCGAAGGAVGDAAVASAAAVSEVEAQGFLGKLQPMFEACVCALMSKDLSRAMQEKVRAVLADLLRHVPALLHGDGGVCLVSDVYASGAAKPAVFARSSLGERLGQRPTDSKITKTDVEAYDAIFEAELKAGGHCAAHSIFADGGTKPRATKYDDQKVGLTQSSGIGNEDL